MINGRVSSIHQANRSHDRLLSGLGYSRDKNEQNLDAFN